MAEKTAIQWTDSSQNPIVVKGGGWYCIKVSEGCQHCYAEKLNQSPYYHGNQLKYKHLPQMPELELKRDMLAGWAKKTKPRRHFVSSMTDVFGEFVPDEWIFEILDAMLPAPLQTFQVLTKRAERMYQMCLAWLEARGLSSLPPNIWIMVSVDNQGRADERIPWLLRVPAFIHGLSVEPLLGPIDLKWCDWCGRFGDHDCEGGYTWAKTIKEDQAGINWVIIGGESGHDARPFYIGWARDLISQCRPAGVPVFMKQLGSNQAGDGFDPADWPRMTYFGRFTDDKKGGNPDEWPKELRVREFPQLKIEAGQMAKSACD